MTDVIAHRGASVLEVENTIAAFRRAVHLGAHGIELDVRRCVDGVLVVHHDPHLPDGRLVAATPWADLPDEVPTFGDALDACAGAWVDIEIKNLPYEPDFDADDRVAVGVLAELAERAERDTGRWLLSAFRLETIDRCRRLDPTVPTAWLTGAIEPWVIETAVQRGHTAVHPWEPTVTAAHIAECHDAGVLVNTWTCNEPSRFAELISWGVDGVVTDVPEVMLGVLAG